MRCPAAQTIVEIGDASELTLNHGPLDQRVVERQHSDRCRVVTERGFRLDQLLGIGVAIVQLERQRDGAAMRWDAHEHSGLRIAPGEHVAEATAGLEPDAQLGGTVDLRLYA